MKWALAGVYIALGATNLILASQMARCQEPLIAAVTLFLGVVAVAVGLITVRVMNMLEAKLSAEGK